MIAVDDGQRDREAPAKSLETLLERISIYAGRFLKIEVPGSQSSYGYSTQDYIAVGKLVGLQLATNFRGIYVYMDPDRTDPKEIRLTSSVSVLGDGGWVSIHDPKNGN